MTISSFKTGIMGDSALAGNPAAIPVVTGGTLTSDATYYYRTFTASGSLNISDAPLACDVLVVGAGGAGGRVRWLTGQSLTGNLQALVGGGATYDTNGNPTILGSIYADGGNKGTYGFPGSGGTAYDASSGNGGNGGYGSPQAPTAGAAGTNAYSAMLTTVGVGASGRIAGGGGGGGWDLNGAAGGAGGGGAGGASIPQGTGYSGTAGTANTGGGGGGGGAGSNGTPYGGAGGSGVVIVRYLKTAV